MEALFFSLNYICEMKQTLGLLYGMLIVISSTAQVTDTLGLEGYEMGTETLYEAPNGGYAFGNNGYADMAKAQSFVNDHSFVLREVLLRFGDVQFASADSSSAITVNVYTFGGFGVTLSSVTDPVAPDTIRSSVPIPVYELSNNSYTSVDFGFDTIVFQAGERFFVGIDFTGLASGDTVGLLSTTDGDAGSTYNAWELTASENWIVVAHPAYSWNLDVDLGIFAVIDENDPSGIVDNEGVNWTFGPNPCLDMLKVEIPFENDEEYVVQVISATGQLMYSETCVGGTYNLNSATWLPGFYLLQVSSTSYTSSQKFVKL